MESSGALTDLLHRAQAGEATAADAFFRESYPMLERLARARLRAHQRTPTLDTGALVNEACLRFVSAGRLRIEDSTHFRRWAARVMRSVIVDLARRRQADRRGGKLVKVTLDPALGIEAPGGEDLVIRVHDALENFAIIDPRAAQVVELRYFAGMTEIEVANALGVTERTIRRDWDKARLILSEMLR